MAYISVLMLLGARMTIRSDRRRQAEFRCGDVRLILRLLDMFPNGECWSSNYRSPVRRLVNKYMKIQSGTELLIRRHIPKRYKCR